jgi:hypothetical protein
MCVQILDDGKQCRAGPIAGSDFCFFHSPEHQEEAAEARRLGGVRRRRERVVSSAFDFEGLDTIPKVTRLVEVAVLDTLGLENSVARNRTLAYLAQTAARLLESGQFEERLRNLEEAMQARLNAA